MRQIRTGQTERNNRKCALASGLALVLVALVAACGGASTAPQTGIAATVVSTFTATAAPTSTAAATVTATRMSPTATPRAHPPTPTPTPKPVPPSTVTVDIVDTGGGNFAFSPLKITIKAGTKVKWVNKTSAYHTSTSQSGPASWDSGTINPNASFTYTFASPGIYTYHCSYHPSMASGTITVTS